MAEVKVERRHREAAVRIATDALANSDPLPERIGEWLENSVGSPIDVRAEVWLGTLSEAIAAAEFAGRQAAESMATAVSLLGERGATFYFSHQEFKLDADELVAVAHGECGMPLPSPPKPGAR